MSSQENPNNYNLKKEKKIFSIEEDLYKIKYDHRENIFIIRPLKENLLYADSLTHFCLSKFHDHLIRNIVLLGSSNHGKTSFISQIIFCQNNRVNKEFPRMRNDEINSGISIVLTPYTIIVPNYRRSSFLLSVLDTPGHPDLLNEVKDGCRLSDGIVMLIDCIEGISIYSKKLLNIAKLFNLKIYFVINKIDRLITELRLPPRYTYRKLDNLILDILTMIKTTLGVKLDYDKFIHEDIAYAITSANCIFNISSFSKIYQNYFSATSIFSEFSQWLWGNRFIIPETNILSSHSSLDSSFYSGIFFVIVPFYKLINLCIAENVDKINKFLNKYILSKNIIKVFDSPISILKKVFIRLFNPLHFFLSITLCYFDKNTYISINYLTEQYQSLKKHYPNSKAILKKNRTVFLITKYYINQPSGLVYPFGRIIKGILSKNFYFPIEKKDNFHTKIEINEVFLLCANFLSKITKVYEGNICLINLNYTICKSDEILFLQDYSNNLKYLILEKKQSFKKLITDINSCFFRVSVEPFYSYELPKLLNGLSKSLIISPQNKISIQDSGNILIHSVGEFSMNLFIKEIVNLYSDVFLRIGTPFVEARESVKTTSKIGCNTFSEDSKITIGIKAEPLIIELYSSFSTNHNENIVMSEEYNVNKYERIKKAKKENYIWCYKNETYQHSILIDNRSVIFNSVKAEKIIKKLITNGFSWAITKGPICEEPIHKVLFRISNINISDSINSKSFIEVSSLVRKAIHGSLLLSEPVLLEPYYEVQVLLPFDCIKTIINILESRRCIITNDHFQEGTIYYLILGYIPIIETIGLETDLRYHTQGQSQILYLMNDFRMMDGNPLEIQNKTDNHLTSIASILATNIRIRKKILKNLKVNNVYDDKMIAKLLVA